MQHLYLYIVAIASWLALPAWAEEAQQDLGGVESRTVAANTSPANEESPAGGKPATVVEDSRTQNYDYSLANKQSAEAEKIKEASAPKVRQFHEVLDELLAEFGYDVRMKQLNGLKNLAIRRVAVSDTLPLSYGDYVELLVAERLRENARIRLINCIPCKTKTSRLVDSKLRITSPLTNVTEMQQAAEQMGIENFMDVVFVYHTTHMVLAFQIFDTSTKELVWARTYNSETIKSRFQKLAVDYSQVAKARQPGEEYKADYRYMFGVGGASVPNVGGKAGDNSFLALSFRATERFNNRHSEFGLLGNYYSAFSSILTDYPSVRDASTPAGSGSTPKVGPQPFKSAFSLYALYAHNFLGSIESYNTIRHGITGGVGALMSTGFMAGTMRGGWDTYFGRTFAVSLNGLYVMASSIKVNGESVRTQGGTGAELVVSYNF